MRRTIAIALILCALPAGGVAYAAQATGEAEIEMEDFAFVPARKVVRKGQLVKWKNSDRAPHNAVATKRVDGKPVFRTRTINKDGRVTIRAPRTAGTYRYICTIHPQMKGTLVVR